jgi:hypothetical protein
MLPLSGSQWRNSEAPTQEEGVPRPEEHTAHAPGSHHAHRGEIPVEQLNVAFLHGWSMANPGSPGPVPVQEAAARSTSDRA